MSKRKLSVIILFAMAVTISGCGKEMFPKTVDTSNTGAAGEEDVDITTRTLIRELEDKLSSSGITTEEYISLSKLYREEKLVQKERDILEQCVRLTGNGEAYSLLQDIVVNVQEEDSAMNHELARLSDYMGTEDYFGEAVAILMTEEWKNLMMPKMKQGRRNYYKEDLQTDTVLYIETGFLKDGTFFTGVWRISKEGKLSYFSQSGSHINMYSCGYRDGELDGDFTQWICDRETGNIRQVLGTFAEGVCVGEFTFRIHNGSGNADLFALWDSKEQLDYEEYTGAFDDFGHPILEQPTEESLDNSNPLLAYACDADRKKYLYISFGDFSETEGYVFMSNVFNMEGIPAYEAYEPVPDLNSDSVIDDTNSVDSAAPPIRIYDSNIEWFNGTNWVTVGSIEDISRKDPFNQYSDGEIEVEVTSQEERVTSEYGNKGLSVAEVSKPSTQKPADSQKPSTQKPSTTKPTNQNSSTGKPSTQGTQPQNTQTPPTASQGTTPSQPAAPQNPPATEPTAPPQTQPSTEPTAPPQSQPSTEPTTPPQTQPPTEPTTPPTEPSTPSSGDTDVEWTDDLL